MSIELIVFIAMVVTFTGGCFLLKLPVSLSMVLAAVVGSLAGGQGFPLRHLVEGTFAYIDTILVIATAMIFMKVIQESGALDALSSLILEKFHRFPALLLCMIMLIIMFPGMITGSSTASVLSAGAIMAPVLMFMGIPKLQTGCILAMGGILGMIAPPVNIPAMIIGGGVDIPYVGFDLPLALLTFPLAFLFVLFFGYRYVRHMNYEEVRTKIDHSSRKQYGVRIYAPIFLAVLLMVLNKAVPAVPDIGMPVVFLIAAGVGLFTGRKIKVLTACRDAVNIVLPVLGILMGVGMFIQVMTLTGVRGLIVTSCIRLPDSMRYLAMSVSIPLFGAVSSFGASSVLGVPFLLSFLGRSQVITAAAISLIASLGDMMPPTALAGIFAAQVVGMEKYTLILRKCLIPGLIIILWGVLFVVFATPLSKILIF